MKLRALPLGLLCAVLALGTAVVGRPLQSASADAAYYHSPVRIMLGGDSITQGFSGDFTWRYRLYEELKRQGVSFDFVGPRNNPYPYYGQQRYAVPSGWDTDHDATGGTRLRTELNNIVTDMANADPDVMVELYGTTDLLPRPAGDPNPTVPLDQEIDDLRTYIKDVRQVNANVDIVLGEVTTRRVPNRQAFNDAVNSLAVEENQPTDPSNYFPNSRVVVADLDPGWDPNKNSYDTVHPNPVGEAVIAQRVAWALKALNVVPGAPKISTAGLHYAPNWAPRIRVSKSRRIVIDWYTTKGMAGAQMMRVRIKVLHTGQVKYSAWTEALNYVSPAFPRGRYLVSIEGRRQSMISPWSKVWTITVRN